MNKETIINAENIKFKVFETKIDPILKGTKPEDKANEYYETEKQNDYEKYVCENELKLYDRQVYESNIVDTQTEYSNICTEISFKPCNNNGGIYLEPHNQTKKCGLKKKKYLCELKIKEESYVESKSSGNIQNESNFFCNNTKEQHKYIVDSETITDINEIDRENNKKKCSLLKYDSKISAIGKINNVKSRKKIKKLKNLKSKILSKEYCMLQRSKKRKSDTNLLNYVNNVDEEKCQANLKKYHSQEDINENKKNAECIKTGNQPICTYADSNNSTTITNKYANPENINMTPSYVQEKIDDPGIPNSPHSDSLQSSKSFDYVEIFPSNVIQGEKHAESLLKVPIETSKSKDYKIKNVQSKKNNNLFEKVQSSYVEKLPSLVVGQLNPPDISNDIKVNLKKIKPGSLPSINADGANSKKYKDLSSKALHTNDIQPVQMERLVSQDSRKEMEKDSSIVESDVDKYLKSFIKCSNGSFVEYPLLNNDPPNSKRDLITWQLNKIFLPQFKPIIEPPPWLRITIPADGYSCNICGDIFFMEGSLIQHKERRSVLISLDCGPCDAKLIFYNRCAFKDHIQEHSLVGESVDVKSVNVDSLPLQLSKLLQPIMVPVPEALRQAKERSSNFLSHVSELEENTEENDSSVGVTSTKNCNNYIGKDPRFNLNGTSQNKRHVRCYLCERMFSNVRELMSHMRTNQTYSDQRVECRKCLLVLPSVCAAKAHILTHPPANTSNISVCPECGSKCEGPRDFVHHLNTCGHQFRRSGILCTLCQVCFFKFSEDFINHWIKEHCLKFFECIVCSKTFPTVLFHNCCTPGEEILSTFKCLLRCPLCSYSFQHHSQDERESQEKIKTHLSDFHKQFINRIYYVYKSKFCTNAFKSKDELRAHHDREHKRDNHYRTKTCALYHEVLRYQSQYFNGQEPRSAFITLPVALSAEELHDASTRDVPTVSSVVDKSFSPSSPVSNEENKKLSNSSFSDNEEALERLSPCICYMCGYNYTGEKHFEKHKQHCEGELTERLCQDCGVSAYGKEFSTHCLNHIIEGRIICIYCNGAPFSSKTNLQRHFELHVNQQFTYPLTCVFCSFVMIDAESALAHIFNKHDPYKMQQIKSVEQEQHVHFVKTALASSQLSSDLDSSISNPSGGRQCKVCKRHLNSDMFSKHMICHLEEGLLLCCLCDGLVLPSSRAFLQHLELHVKSLIFPYHCLMCSTEIHDPLDAMLHIKEDHGFGELTCENCEMNYKFRYQLQRHIDIVHKICLFAKRRYICWICRAYDNVKKEMLMSHFRISHQLSKEEVDETVMIRTRGQGTMPSSHFAPIKPIGCKENKENICSLSTSESNLLNSKNSARNNSVSPSKSIDIQVDINYNTSNKSNKSHMEVDIKVEPNPMDCSSSISSTFPLDSSSDLYTEVKSESNSVDDILERKLLQKVSKKNRDRKLINNTKVLIKRLPETFDSKEGTVILVNKQKNISEIKGKKCLKSKTFQCNLCSFGTNSGDKYEYHSNKHNTNTESFKCETCGESFVVELSLQRHMFFAHKVKSRGSVNAGKLLQTNLNSVPTVNNEKVAKPKIRHVQNSAQKRTGASFQRKQMKPKSGLKKLKISRSKSNSSWHLKVTNKRNFLKKVKRRQLKPSLEINLQEQTQSSELQCSVCRQHFSTDAQLFSHLRTHGMAFLKIGLKNRSKSSEVTATSL